MTESWSESWKGRVMIRLWSSFIRSWTLVNQMYDTTKVSRHEALLIDICYSLWLLGLIPTFLSSFYLIVESVWHVFGGGELQNARRSPFP